MSLENVCFLSRRHSFFPFFRTMYRRCWKSRNQSREITKSSSQEGYGCLWLDHSQSCLYLVKFQCVSFHMNIIILIKNSIHVYRMDIIITIHYQMNKINWCVKVIVPLSFCLIRKWIIFSQTFLKEGELMKLSRKEMQPRMFFLVRGI